MSQRILGPHVQSHKGIRAETARVYCCDLPFFRICYEVAILPTLVSKALITKCPKLGGSKQRKCIVPQDWEPDVQNQGVSGPRSRPRLRQEPFLASLASGTCQRFLAARSASGPMAAFSRCLCPSVLHAPVSVRLSPCACLCAPVSVRLSLCTHLPVL